MQRLYNEFDRRIDEKGFVRQHIAKDATCLFRCVAQQVHQSQTYHTRVKEEFIEYLRRNGHEINFSGLSVEEYVEKVSSDAYYATITDALILMKMYEINAYIWTMDDNELESCGHQPNTCNCLILSYDESCSQFDVVVTKEEEKLMAFAQSMVYEAAFNIFFGCNSDVLQQTVKQMLDEKHYAKVKKEKKILAKQTSSEVRYDETDLPPISYAAAKCLNAKIYRNEVFHNWMKRNQEAFQNFIKLVTPLTRGMRVVFETDGQSLDGYVQRIDENRVLVYVVPLMQRLWFRRAQLKPFPYAKSEEQKESKRRRFRRSNSSTVSSGSGDYQQQLASSQPLAIRGTPLSYSPSFFGNSPTFHFQSHFAMTNASQVFFYSDAMNGLFHSTLYYGPQ